MLTEGLSYEEQLEDYRLVYELLKRKLRRFPRMNIPELRRIFVHFQGVKRGA